ncbi:MAG: hypothetical protein JW741_12340 [Sedimentisphaerales bacterium]|nr:hypothetical protein [Sedimentisphaerales bacterium]
MKRRIAFLQGSWGAYALRLTAPALALALLAPHALGQTYWNGNAGDGDWGNTDNWSAGLPSATVGADFSQVAAIGTVTLDADYTVPGWKANNGNTSMVLDCNGYELKATSFAQLAYSSCPDYSLEYTGTAGSKVTADINNNVWMYRNNQVNATIEQYAFTLSGQVHVLQKQTRFCDSNQLFYELDAALTIKDGAIFEVGNWFYVAGNLFGSNSNNEDGGDVRMVLDIRDSATFNATGKTVNLGKANPAYGDPSFVTLIVRGRNATVDLGNLTFDNGALRPVIDHATDFGTIAAGTLTVGSVTVEPELDGVVPAMGQVYDILAYTGAKSGNFTLDSGAAGAWELIDNTDEKTIQLKYVVPSNLGTVITVR